MAISVRNRLRAYGAALVISAAALGAVPDMRIATPTAIIRPTAGRRQRFDPVEEVDGIIVTVPLVFGSRAGIPARSYTPHPN